MLIQLDICTMTSDIFDDKSITTTTTTRKSQFYLSKLEKKKTMNAYITFRGLWLLAEVQVFIRIIPATSKIL